MTQHSKQAHVLELLDAGRAGNIVALLITECVSHLHGLKWGRSSDFLPSQHIHYSKSDLDYTLDVNVFDNLYAEGDDMKMMKKGYKNGGKMPMKKGPDGKMVPEFAMDGEGQTT